MNDKICVDVSGTDQLEELACLNDIGARTL